MLIEFVGGAACAAAGLMTYGVRGRSSSLFAPSVWRGPAGRRALALTFDDGPSEGTPRVLELLERHSVPSTFFQCGVNVRRLPAVARQVAAAGHEIGNHSDTHARLYLRGRRFIAGELTRAQASIADATGASPRLFRAPYGARWFHLRPVQRQLGLMGVMWTVLGRDWKLPAAQIAARLRAGASNGAVFCLHDGRELRPRPDLSELLSALSRVVPELLDRGFQFQTASELLCPKTSSTE